MSENPIIQILGGEYDVNTGRISFAGGQVILVNPEKLPASLFDIFGLLSGLYSDQKTAMGFTDESGKIFFSLNNSGELDFLPSADLVAKIKEFYPDSNALTYKSGEYLVDGTETEFGFCDEEDRVFLSVKEDGSVDFIPSQSLREKLKNDIHIKNDVINMEGNVFFVRQINNGLLQFLSDAEGQTRSYLQRTDIVSNTAMFEAKGPIFLLSGAGQSLSIGGGATENPAGEEIFTTEPINPHHNFMFNTGTRGRGDQVFDPSTVTDFVPAFEQYDGANAAETQGSGMMRALHAAHVRNSEAFKTYVYRSHGKGGASITELLPDSVMYQNGIKEVQRAKEIADKYGRKLDASFVMWSQGQQDRVFMTRADHKAHLATVQTAYSTDLPVITGSSDPVHFVINQLADAHTDNTSEVSFAQYEFAKENENVHISTPDYIFAYSGSVHLKPKEYSLLGEYQSKVIRAELLAREKEDPTLGWKDFKPISIVLVDNVITYTFDPMKPPLKFKKIRDDLPFAENFGFEYTDDSVSPPTITDVQITSATTVQATLSAIPMGANKLARYASVGTGNPSGTYAGAWGNLCDSDDQPSETDAEIPLNNFCQIFEEAL